MLVKQKARKAQIIWIYGNKQKGVSVKLMRWARPLWRVSLWKGGRIFKSSKPAPDRQRRPRAIDRSIWPDSALDARCGAG